ncbi:MAG: enoyl-CoA hydratase/isomerase family protein [Bradymonadia bacterium]
MTELIIEAPGKNALGLALMDTLIDGIKAAGDGPLLLTGAGDAFSAGLNLKEVLAADLDDMRVFLHKLTELMALLHHHPGPTVAAVNGHAIAGGCLLALLCDVRFCTDNARARIGLNEVALGLRFPPRVLRLAVSRLAPCHVSEVILGAGLHGPTESQRLGLVDHVVSNPLADARGMLKTLSSYPADAYAAAKHALRAHTDPDDPEGDALFESDVLPIWAGPEVKGRIKALLKR